MKCEYKGYISCDEDDICKRHLFSEVIMIDDISIIEDILGKMVEYGDYLSVSYFICSHEMTKNKACKHLYGYADGICEVSYSETTGYLWTNQELNVGGHDLVAELVSYKDKYIILTIEFNKCEPEK